MAKLATMDLLASCGTLPVYDNLRALGEKKQKYKMLKELQEQCCEGQHLSREDLHVKKERRLANLPKTKLSLMNHGRTMLDMI